MLECLSLASLSSLLQCKKIFMRSSCDILWTGLSHELRMMVVCDQSDQKILKSSPNFVESSQNCNQNNKTQIESPK
jgi:hypothetical protein